MLYTIITTTNARLDITEAMEWEDKRKPGLAERFLRDLEKKLSSISLTPYLGQVRYDDIRCVGTDIFQYLIHYVIDDTRQIVIVLRVLHTSRKPIW